MTIGRAEVTTAFIMSRRSPDYAQGRYGQARTDGQDERRQGSAWTEQRERSRSPVRRNAQRDPQATAQKFDPYDEGITNSTHQTADKQASHTSYQPYTAASSDRWEKGRDVQELENPYGYSQPYAGAQSYANHQSYTNAQAYAQAQCQNQAYYPTEAAAGLPYDPAPSATYQDPQYGGYTATDYSAGRIHDRQANPQSRDVIFLGLEATYTEETVCPFDSCSFLVLTAAVDARVSAHTMRSTCRQDDDCQGP
jgi:hypothetical protein